MTLPSSGTISLSNFNTELGQASTYAGSLSFIKSNAKTPANDFNSYRGQSYFQSNTAGNCNNGNCVVDCACGAGAYQCANCVSVQCVNCANCDTQAYLQTGSNCACTYNCNAGTRNIQCNCNCDCTCYACFVAGSPVLMADGTLMAIETIKAGDRVRTRRGVGTVLETKVTSLGIGRSVIAVGSEGLLMSDDHSLWASDGAREGWGTFNLRHWLYERDVLRAISPELPREENPIVLDKSRSSLLAHRTGWLAVAPVHQPGYGPRTALHHIVVDDGSYIVGGFVVISKEHAGYDQADGIRWAGVCGSSSLVLDEAAA